MKLNIGYLVAEEERRWREEREQRPALYVPTPTVEEWEEWKKREERK